MNLTRRSFIETTAGAVAAFVASKLAGTPSNEVLKLYDDAVAYVDAFNYDD